MKTIKVKFVGFWDELLLDRLPLYQAMTKYYNVELSDKPDYIICSVFDYYGYCKYPQVRIMYSGENYTPDFNLIDYAISPYPIEFHDRHLCFPQCLGGYNGRGQQLLSKDRNFNSEILDQKIYFANFICGHESENGIRGEFFKRLCNYKTVCSPGTYLNNMPNGMLVNMDNKVDFQKKCKFTLCFESTNHYGFVTEKITDAFFSDTIPVYYGSSSVNDIFNKKAFINVSDYNSFDQAIDRIIELDQNDELYLKVLRQPVFNDNNFLSDKFIELERFVNNIFEQPLEKAFRRSKVYWPRLYEQHILESNHCLDDYSGKELVSCLKKRISNKFFR